MLNLNLPEAAAWGTFISSPLTKITLLNVSPLKSLQSLLGSIPGNLPLVLGEQRQCVQKSQLWQTISGHAFFPGDQGLKNIPLGVI